jgi:DNA replication protein DnaC
MSDIQFNALKLYGMAGCYAELRSQNTPDVAARFPVQRHLQGFDFGQSKVEQQLIHHLATMEFTASAQNLVLVGGAGTGKKPTWPLLLVLQAYSNITRKRVSTAR